MPTAAKTPLPQPRSRLPDRSTPNSRNLDRTNATQGEMERLIGQNRGVPPVIDSR